MSPFLVLEVHRDHLITDTLAQIRLKETDLKKPLKIKYVGGGEQVILNFFLFKILFVDFPAC